jgi:S-adenosylmethionine synthetase
MKILVTGASGLLGRAVKYELEHASQHNIVGIALNRASDKLHRLNLLDEQAVCELISSERPHYIVHCAAERRPDKCEGDEQGTMQLNVDATRTLANCARVLGAWFIYISTDYVFDGTSPPYRPEDTPRPLNLYGKSKLAGEEVVRELLHDHCILRVPVLYGEVQSLDESPVTLVAKEVINQQLRIYDHWSVRYPTYVDDVAYVIRQLIGYKSASPAFSGTFHWSGAEAFTRYQMALVVSELLNLPRELVLPSEEPSSGAQRPQNAHLDCSKLEKLEIGRRTPFLEGLKRVLEPAAIKLNLPPALPI